MIFSISNINIKYSPLHEKGYAAHKSSEAGGKSLVLGMHPYITICDTNGKDVDILRKEWIDYNSGEKVSCEEMIESAYGYEFYDNNDRLGTISFIDASESSDEKYIAVNDPVIGYLTSLEHNATDDEIALELNNLALTCTLNKWPVFLESFVKYIIVSSMIDEDGEALSYLYDITRRSMYYANATVLVPYLDFDRDLINSSLCCVDIQDLCDRDAEIEAKAFDYDVAGQLIHRFGQILHHISGIMIHMVSSIILDEEVLEKARKDFFNFSIKSEGLRSGFCFTRNQKRNRRAIFSAKDFNELQDTCFNTNIVELTSDRRAKFKKETDAEIYAKLLKKNQLLSDKSPVIHKAWILIEDIISRWSSGMQEVQEGLSEIKRMNVSDAKRFFIEKIASLYSSAITQIMSIDSDIEALMSDKKKVIIKMPRLDHSVNTSFCGCLFKKSFLAELYLSYEVCVPRVLLFTGAAQDNEDETECQACACKRSLPALVRR